MTSTRTKAVTIGSGHRPSIVSILQSDAVESADQTHKKYIGGLEIQPAQRERKKQ